MPFSDFFGGIVSGIGSIFNGISQAASNRAQAKENEKNRQFALDMWNRENEFNLPQNQIGRFQSAGLNPALVYGQGTSALAAHASTPSTNNQFTAPQFDGNSALQGYFQSKQLSNETKVAESQEYLNNSSANKAQSDAALADMQKEKLSNENKFFLDNYETALKSNLEDLEIKKNQHLIGDEEYKIKKEELNKKIEEVRQQKAIADKAEEEVSTQKAVTRQVEQSILTSKAQEDAFRASAKLSSAEAVKALEEAATNKVMRNKLNLDAALDQANINYLKKMGAKTDSEAKKIIIDAYNSILNGEVDRFIKTGPQRFGTGTLGAAVGIFTDQIGFNPGTQTIGGYINKRYLEPTFKPIKWHLQKYKNIPKSKNKKR